MNWLDPVIHPITPWLPERHLSEAVEMNVRPVPNGHWVLILDWDCYIGLDKRWYDKCASAIAQVPNAGVISCMTNRIGSPLQKMAGAPPGRNISDHEEFAQSLPDEAILRDVTDIRTAKLSGMFFLIKRDTFDEIPELPRSKFIGLDNWLGDRIREIGRRLYVITSLYVFHGYRRTWQRPKE